MRLNLQVAESLVLPRRRTYALEKTDEEHRISVLESSTREPTYHDDRSCR